MYSTIRVLIPSRPGLKRKRTQTSPRSVTKAEFERLLKRRRRPNLFGGRYYSSDEMPGDSESESDSIFDDDFDEQSTSLTPSSSHSKSVHASTTSSGSVLTSASRNLRDVQCEVANNCVYGAQTLSESSSDGESCSRSLRDVQTPSGSTLSSPIAGVAPCDTPE